MGENSFGRVNFRFGSVTVGLREQQPALAFAGVLTSAAVVGGATSGGALAGIDTITLSESNQYQYFPSFMLRGLTNLEIEFTAAQGVTA